MLMPPARAAIERAYAAAITSTPLRRHELIPALLTLLTRDKRAIEVAPLLPSPYYAQRVAAALRDNIAQDMIPCHAVEDIAAAALHAISTVYFHTPLTLRHVSMPPATALPDAAPLFDVEIFNICRRAMLRDSASRCRQDSVARGSVQRCVRAGSRRGAHHGASDVACGGEGEVARYEARRCYC